MRAPQRLFGAGYTRDAFDALAFQFRMGAGFFGDVNRTHPFWVEPGLMDPTSPPTAYGQAVVVDSVSKKIRRVLAGGRSIDPYLRLHGAAVPVQRSRHERGLWCSGAGRIHDSDPEPADRRHAIRLYDHLCERSARQRRPGLMRVDRGVVDCP